MIEKLNVDPGDLIPQGGTHLVLANKIDELIDAINTLKKFVYYAQGEDTCSQEDLDELEEFAGITHDE